MQTAKRRKTRKESAGITAFDIFVVLYIAHNHLPAVGFYMPSIIYFGCFAIIAALLLMSSVSSLKVLSLIAIFALDGWNIVYMLFNENFITIARDIYGSLQTFLYGWIALTYVLQKDPKKAKRVLYVLITCFIITSITTIVGNYKYPGASRLLATSIADTNVTVYNRYVSANIGGFSFIYGLMLIMPLLIYLAKKKKINFIFAILMFAIIGLAVISSEYSAALIIFMMNLILFAFRKLTKKKIMILIAIFLIFIVVGSPFLAMLFDKIADILPQKTVSSRFEYIAAFLRGEDVEDHAGDSNRKDLYTKAMREIRESKLLGTWGRTNGSGHSMILNTVVKYGLIGIFILIVMYKAIYKYAIYPHKKKDYGPYLIWIYLIAIFFALLNPKANLFIFIFVIPLFSYAIDNDKKLKKDEK